MARLDRVACIVADGFEDSELRVPLEKMREAGLRVDLIGAEAGQDLKGLHGRERVRTDKGINEVSVEDYSLLFIPGGHSPDVLRSDERFVEFIREFDEAEKPIAAICHGPQLLITAGLVKGRTLTAWKTVRRYLELIGADVKDAPLVVDRNWITSRQPEDLDAFSAAILAELRGRPVPVLDAR